MTCSLRFPPRGLRQRVEEFLSDYVKNDSRKQVYRSEIIKYLFQIQSGKGMKRLRELAAEDDIANDYSHFSKQYLSISHYLHVVLFKTYHATLLSGSPEPEGVLAEDITYINSVITDRDRQLISEKPLNPTLDTSSIDLSTFKTGQTVKRDVMSYAKSKISSLSFLSKYDSGVTQDDFKQDLAEEIVKVKNTYHRSPGKSIEKTDNTNLFEKYLEITLNNKVKNIKQYYQCETRKRVGTTEHEKYKLRAKLTKELSSASAERAQEIQAELRELNTAIRNGQGDYYSNVSSLSFHDSAEDRSIEIDESTLDGLTNSKSRQEKIDEELWTESLLMKMFKRLREKIKECLVGEDPDFLVYRHRHKAQDLTTALKSYLDLEEETYQKLLCNEDAPNYKYARFLRIAIGHEDAEFERWAESANIKMNSPSSINLAAKKYLGIDKNAIIRNPVIKEILLPELGRA